MNDEIEVLAPDAQLLESMRAVGYSLKTALADLCDNSITAEATSIRIMFASAPSPCVAILDDGLGMAKSDLRIAMRLAGKSPRTDRPTSDLGRFGLGLKTASLSQARSLTVVSKIGDVVCAARWDLDHVLNANAWELIWLNDQEISKLPWISDLQSQASGTLVIWQKLDLMLGSEEISNMTQGHIDRMNSMLDHAFKHLSLTFHRFIDSPPPSRVTIFANGNQLKSIDPFLSSGPGVQRKPENIFRIGTHKVSVTPFILPSLQKMTESQKVEVLFAGSLKEAQGFYIYRNKRLLSYGNWFRIVGRSEMAKLARVRVDTDNEMDLAWKLGIMKSSVEPPELLRKSLAKLVPVIIGDSEVVSIGRGRVVASKHVSAWEVRESGAGSFSVEINREHPLITLLFEKSTSAQQKTLQDVLEMLENQFPAQYIHQRLSGDMKFENDESSESDYLAFANSLWLALRPTCSNDSEAWDEVLAIEPFASNVNARLAISKMRGTN